MNSAEYVVIKMDHRGFHLISCGRSLATANEQLYMFLKVLLVSSNMLNENPKASASYFEQLTSDSINNADVAGKLKTFKLTGMAGVLDGQQRISQIASQNTDTDTLRYWACVWSLAERGAGALLQEEPVVEDLRWLVTDDGFYITRTHPARNIGATVEQRKRTLEDLSSHLAIAKN